MPLNRKKFFQETLKILSAGAFLLFNGDRVLPAASKIQEDPMSKKTEFLHGWLSNLMKNMDQNLDKETKIQLLEKCGRACAKRQAQQEALKFQGKLDGWLKKMKQFATVLAGG
jgi:S-adenosylmethionine:tRNA-ribosyltransferase-isomerase (queuine synthetase)